jgi:hypothetical protein
MAIDNLIRLRRSSLHKFVRAAVRHAEQMGCE